MIEYIILSICVFVIGYLTGMRRFIHTAWRYDFINRKNYNRYKNGVSKPQW